MAYHECIELEIIGQATMLSGLLFEEKDWNYSRDKWIIYHTTMHQAIIHSLSTSIAKKSIKQTGYRSSMFKP